MKTNNLTESAHVGRELLGGERGELYRNCLVVKQSVQDGDFSLLEALEIYGVTPQQYEEFLAQNALQDIQVSILGASPKEKVVLTVDVVATMFQAIAGTIGRSEYILSLMQELSKNIKEEKLPNSQHGEIK